MNPVSSPHFNFTIPEPTGVVGIVADNNTSLIGLVSMLAPVICGGNTCIVLASTELPLCAISFAEVLNSSDVPGGVVNVITGEAEEMLTPMSKHMDVNAIAFSGGNKNTHEMLKVNSALNLKRIRIYQKDWMKKESQDLFLIEDFQEMKTTWHPIENIGGASSTY